MFNSWVGKIPWRWKWQAAYSPWGHKGQTRLSDSTTALPPPPFVISELRSREFSSSQCQHFLSFLPFSFFPPPPCPPSLPSSLSFSSPWKEVPYDFCHCSVTQSCPTLCDPMDCSTPGLPVSHHFPKFALGHVHSLLQ